MLPSGSPRRGAVAGWLPGRSRCWPCFRPAGAGLSALVAGGTALPPGWVADSHGNGPSRPRAGAVRRWFGGGERFGRHWLLARHRGRAVLVSTHGDARSCWMVMKLAAVHGHARMDLVMLLDPVATDVLSCWRDLAHRVEAPQ